MSFVDLRSDTVTRPTAEMRRAMAEAEVGDDVYGEDPTVRLLEEEGAAAMGKAAALFVPSGIMGNQIALALHAPRGSEVLCDARAHILLYEVGAMAAISGLQPHPMPSRDGLPGVEDVASAYVARGGYRVPSGVLELENTHNVAGGRAFARSRIEPLLDFARDRALPTHLDGARIFNAATALGAPASELARGFDSVMFCLSKGLGAPVGSLLCGAEDFIAEARERRRMLGGAMRQVGVLAAAGRVALRSGPSLLSADHEHARLLASAVAELPGLEIDLASVETNILIFGVRPGPGEAAGQASRWVAAARAEGILASALDASRVRLVTHRDLDRPAIERAIAAMRRIAA